MTKLIETKVKNLDAIGQIESDQANAQYIIPYTKEQHLAVLENKDSKHLSIFTQVTDQLIGFIILAGIKSKHQSLELRRIVVNKKGKGFGSSAIQLALELGFNTLGVNRIWLDVFDYNAPAIAVYKKLNFKKEAVLRQVVKTAEGFQNLVLMSILKSEFEFHKQCIYRRAKGSDISGLRDLGLLSYGQFSNSLTAHNWLKMKSYVSDENSYLKLLEIGTGFVCEYKTKIIGMAYLIPPGNPTAIFDKNWSYLRMVGVDPKFSGKGIATKLTKKCISQAKQEEQRKIYLHTSELMDAARHIYGQMGFVRIKELPLHFDIRYWLYEKSLA